MNKISGHAEGHVKRHAMLPEFRLKAEEDKQQDHVIAIRSHPHRYPYSRPMLWKRPTPVSVGDGRPRGGSPASVQSPGGPAHSGTGPHPHRRVGGHRHTPTCHSLLELVTRTKPSPILPSPFLLLLFFFSIKISLCCFSIKAQINMWSRG